MALSGILPLLATAVCLVTMATCQAPSASPPPAPVRQRKTPPLRLYPGQPGYPEHEEFTQLGHKLDGRLVTAFDADYANVSIMWNIRVTGVPMAQIMAESVGDIQKAVLFAKQRNLLVAVRSSGHSFIGRSTHDGGVVINLSLMKQITFDLASTRSAAGEVTVQSGAAWLDVYTAVDKQVTYDAAGKAQRRLVVGGSAHTVAMGGYTQGGGHSPYSRLFGLAVDSLLEASLVLADGRLAVVSAEGVNMTELDGTTSTSNDTSLWWAVRGGGGGTWGVVVTFTFKLHFAPARLRQVVQSWALTYKGSDIGSAELDYILRQLAGLSPQWGGYMLTHGQPLSADAKGAVTLALLHFGDDGDASNHDLDDLLAFNPHKSQYGRTETNFSTFLEYEAGPKDGDHGNAYVYSTFVQPSIANNASQRAGLVKFLMDSVHPPSEDSGIGCTGTLIGGLMDVNRDTPVNPAFRSGLLSLTCSLGWPANSPHEHFYIGEAMKLRDKLAPAGEGAYFNEPAEDLEDWKSKFWGGSATYAKLLAAKKRWDPDAFFWCHNCVGSDGYTAN